MERTPRSPEQPLPGGGATAEPAVELPSRATLRRIVAGCHARMGGPLSDADVEEVVQDVHVQAWRRLGSFRGDSSLESWIFGIARLAILRQLERRDRLTGREVPLEATDGDPEAGGTRPGSRFDTEFRALLHAGIEEVCPDGVAILEAHELEGQPFAAIGERLGLSETAVKSRYYRSLEGLRVRLGPLWRSLTR